MSKMRQVTTLLTVAMLAGCKTSPMPSDVPHVEVAAARPAAVTSAAPARIRAPEVSSYRIVARRKYALHVSRVSASKTSRFGFMGGVPVEVFADSVKIRDDLLAGLESRFAGRSLTFALAGRWPDHAFLAASDGSTNGLFTWRNERWKLLFPKKPRTAAAYALKWWEVSPWFAGRVVAWHVAVGSAGQWMHLAGANSGLPKSGPARASCPDDVMAVSSPVWLPTGEIVALGEVCRDDGAGYRHAARYWTATGEPVVHPLPGVPVLAAHLIYLLQPKPEEIYVFGHTDMTTQPRVGYLARFDGKAWRPLTLPTIRGSVAAHAPGDGKLYLAGDDSLRVLTEVDDWRRIAMPPNRVKTRIAMMGFVDRAMWISAYDWDEKGFPAGYGIMHDGDATVPSDTELEAAFARLNLKP